MEEETPEEREQAELAAREAAGIGGGAPPGAAEPLQKELDGTLDPALRPVYEAGGGEAEGFEDAEELLTEHASHGDERSAHRVLHDAGASEEAIPGSAYGEADREHSSGREDEESPSEP
ncbi:MAG TPA: hypothetical protein VNV44_08755 [Solirubrobacteraceae bacterium]|jgi:hypothetical protein|nr:hypothetical protein [Solirubrobacteraceae bacterium]